MDEPMCEDGDNCLYDMGDAAPDTIEPALHIAQQAKGEICPYMEVVGVDKVVCAYDGDPCTGMRDACSDWK